jgi:hypothetical protein
VTLGAEPGDQLVGVAWPIAVDHDRPCRVDVLIDEEAVDLGLVDRGEPALREGDRARDVAASRGLREAPTVVGGKRPHVDDGQSRISMSVAELRQVDGGVGIRLLHIGHVVVPSRDPRRVVEITKTPAGQGSRRVSRAGPVRNRAQLHRLPCSAVPVHVQQRTLVTEVMRAEFCHPARPRRKAFLTLWGDLLS